MGALFCLCISNLEWNWFFIFIIIWYDEQSSRHNLVCVQRWNARKSNQNDSLQRFLRIVTIFKPFSFELFMCTLVFAHYSIQNITFQRNTHCAIVFADIGSIVKIIIFVIKCFVSAYLKHIPALICAHPRSLQTEETVPLFYCISIEWAQSSLAV